MVCWHARSTGSPYRSQQLGIAGQLPTRSTGRHLIAEPAPVPARHSPGPGAAGSGQKVIISTGTRNLQDQLFLRDLPRLREAMPARPGRAAQGAGQLPVHTTAWNRRCWTHAATAAKTCAGCSKVRDWSARTDRGDISELGDVPEDATIWPLVTSTTDNCLGQGAATGAAATWSRRGGVPRRPTWWWSITTCCAPTLH